MSARRVARDRMKVEFHGGDAIEVALGYGGVGVFLTVLTKRGSAVVTISLGETGAQRLGTVLQQAGAASISNGRALGSSGSSSVVTVNDDGTADVAEAS